MVEPAVDHHPLVAAIELHAAVGAPRRAIGLLVGSLATVDTGILEVLGMEIRAGRLLAGSFEHRVPGILQILGAKILLVGSVGSIVGGILGTVAIGDLQVLGAEIRTIVPRLGLHHRGVIGGRRDRSRCILIELESASSTDQ